MACFVDFATCRALLENRPSEKMQCMNIYIVVSSVSNLNKNWRRRCSFSLKKVNPRAKTGQLDCNAEWNLLITFFVDIFGGIRHLKRCLWKFSRDLSTHNFIWRETEEGDAVIARVRHRVSEFCTTDCKPDKKVLRYFLCELNFIGQHQYLGFSRSIYCSSQCLRSKFEWERSQLGK